MKFFVAFAALVAVAVAKPHISQKPAILPALVDQPAIGPAFVEHEHVQPGFGPALVDFPAVGPVFVEHEHVQPGFGPALVDFPVNAEAGYPVVIGPIPEGSTPLVQIIVNVAKPGGAPAEAGVGASLPSIAPEYVQDVPAVGPAIVEDIDEPVSGVIVADLPDGVAVADLPAVPAEPVLIGNPQLPPSAVNTPNDLN